MGYVAMSSPGVSMIPDDDFADSPMEGEFILPSQFFEGCKKEAGEPIRRLMLAVLADALRCYQKGMGTRSGGRKQAFLEAEQWLFSRTADAPFSFENVCSALNIGPEYFRDALRKWRMDRIREVRVAVVRRSPSVSPKNLTVTGNKLHHSFSRNSPNRSASQG
jgi:hypothetical protein